MVESLGINKQIEGIIENEGADTKITIDIMMNSI